LRLVHPLLRPILGAALAALAIFWISSAPPAHAQGAPSLIRDTEVERVVRTYLDPLLQAAGMSPDSVSLHRQ
jgi:hypothetical protein